MSLEFRKAKHWTATDLEEIMQSLHFTPLHACLPPCLAILIPSHPLTWLFLRDQWRIAKNSSRDHRAHPVREMWQLTFFSPKTTPGFPGALCEDSPRKCLGQDSSSHLSWVSDFLWYVHEGIYSSWAGGNGRAGHKW